MNLHLRRVAQMTVVASASALAFWLLTAHWGHVLGALPFLLFFTCPLMHLFMHHGRGHGADNDGHSDSRTPARR